MAGDLAQANQFNYFLYPMSHDEELWQSFREKNIDTPLWRILWPSGFRTGDAFEANLESVFPTAEMMEHAVDYFHGTRWGHMELAGETREVFEYLMLDYRSVSSFINSSQVARYVENGFVECFDFIVSSLESSPLKNDSNFVWSDPVTKALDSLREMEENLPIGADPVLYLIYDEYHHLFEEWNSPEIFMVRFHGEDALDYHCEGCDCTLLEAMILQGDSPFVGYTWSESVVQRALDLTDELIGTLDGQPPWDRDLQRYQQARKILLGSIECGIA